MKLLFNCILFSFLILVVNSQRQITFRSNCANRVWVSPAANHDSPSQLAQGIVGLSKGGSTTYKISDLGWAGRFWPKTGCDGSGQNCAVGQSDPPCGPKGCTPPAETKVEFFFPSRTSSNQEWYDISLVDGYSLGMKIVPSSQGGTCITTTCDVSLDHCPTNEDFVGDLRVIQNGKTVQCLSPCKKWNWPTPIGLGRDEQQSPGINLCCPTPPIYPDQCRAGPVVNTKYVKLIHQECPTGYGYSYDDVNGLHQCPNGVNFEVVLCP